mmetsp:Transcript_2608/g.4779  ORF Transcript_2608/g.4779 Transcript_2608/m.4779 type:complete len:124 (+) Transcript_2608:314-685(+)
MKPMKMAEIFGSCPTHVVTRPSAITATMITINRTRDGAIAGSVNVKMEEPHMHAIMNILKIRPCGGGSTSDSSAGVQLKTKEYMEPSKAETTIASRLTRQSVLKALIACMHDCERSWNPLLSP